MDDAQQMYRLRWPALRRCLYQLCLRSDRVAVLLDGLRKSTNQTPTGSQALRQAVATWRDAILADLAPKTLATDAWPGWRALMPLFGNTEKLTRALATQSEKICHEAVAGETRVLWYVLHAYFIDTRDHLDGVGPTRLGVWRKIDRIRRDLNT